MGQDMILKVVVGSRAHGLNRPDSDWDYRGVFVVPTRNLLSITLPKPSHTSWIEGQYAPGQEPGLPPEKTDATAWELGHFLHLALQCNPTILEVFAAPVVGTRTAIGNSLLELFPYIWDPKRVRDAFIGYGLNQRKKFLEDKDNRSVKYAQAYLRVLIQANFLLREGKLPVETLQEVAPLSFIRLRRWRDYGYESKGEVIDQCLYWQGEVEDAANHCTHKAQPEKVDEWLLAVRREYWG